MLLQSVLLPTSLLFRHHDSSEYDRIKNEFLIQTFGTNYNEILINEIDTNDPGVSLEEKLTRSKWTRLMNKFCTCIPENMRPLFNDFQQKRKSVERDSRNIMQLDQVLSYFENFYFLYCNQSQGKLLILKIIYTQ